MQTIRSRFLTIICGVSLTLSMVFGAPLSFSSITMKPSLPPGRSMVRQLMSIRR